MKKYVVFGFLAPKEDSKGGKKNRNEHYRPTYAICEKMKEEIKRYELLYEPKHQKEAGYLIKSIEKLIEIKGHQIKIDNPYDIMDVMNKLILWFGNYKFNKNEEYLVNISTGSQAKQLCLFRLAERKDIPSKILSIIPPKINTKDSSCSYTITDLDDSKNKFIAKQNSRNRIEEGKIEAGIYSKEKRNKKKLEEIFTAARKSTAPILLEGATGTGKTYIAKEEIYKIKKEHQKLKGKFIEVNAGAIPDNLIESELLGHEKDAFTGANKEYKGKLEQANDGVLFLDEIGELSEKSQVVLLKAIEEKKFFRIGGTEEITSKFQLIAGTNRNLREMVVQGKFRADLYARIKTFRYKLPNLMERPKDIELLLDNKLKEKYPEKNSTSIFKGITDEARKEFLKFAVSRDALWTYNIRDLHQAVERMVVFSESDIINSKTVKDVIEWLKSEWTPNKQITNTDNSITIPLVEKDGEDLFDTIQLTGVKHICQRAKNFAEASRILFSSSRRKKKSHNDSDRLRKYLKKHNLTWEDIKSNCN